VSPLATPPPSLVGFPSRSLRPDRVLYRVHRRGHNPWYFASGPDGRFNLSEPDGTCYFSETDIGAFLETLGRVGRLIPRAEVEERVISALSVPRAVRLANCTVARARGFGVTVGIHALEDDARTQAWATALHAAGFDGIRYRISHDPRASGVGIALFGPSGEATGPRPPGQPISADLIARIQRQFGLLVVETP
jgi:hypothetical protein